jgi:glycosyltransferase involved in cell wall biosynthesis
MFAALREAGETVPLVVCAPTTHDLESYKTLAAQLGLRNHTDIFFLVAVGADLLALYHGAILFVLLSWYESFSLPLVEAMASGLPIIASNSACLPEIMGDGGILVDPRNIDEWISTVRRVLGSPELQQHLRGRAVERSQFFSWGKTAQETLLVYEELVEPGRECIAL